MQVLLFGRRCFCVAAGAFVWTQVLLFGCRCFCSVACAFVWSQVLLIGCRCFCLAGGVFVWPRGVFLFRPHLLLFDRPSARLPNIRRIELCTSRRWGWGVVVINQNKIKHPHLHHHQAVCATLFRHFVFTPAVLHHIF